MRTSPAEPGPGDAPAGIPVHSPVPRPGDRRHDIEPVRPPVVVPPVTPRPSAVLHLDPEAVRPTSARWDHLKKGQKQRLYGWFQEWADIEAQAAVLRWYEPLVVPGLLQTEDYARAILSARPDGNLDDLDEQAPCLLSPPTHGRNLPDG
jgi:hypothetical protein